MRFIRQLEAKIIGLQGRILELRREKDALKKRADKLQERLDRIEVMSPAIAGHLHDFDKLRERYKGHEIRRGKVRLIQRETA